MDRVEVHLADIAFRLRYQGRGRVPERERAPAERIRDVRAVLAADRLLLAREAQVVDDPLLAYEVRQHYSLHTRIEYPLYNVERGCIQLREAGVSVKVWLRPSLGRSRAPHSLSLSRG